MCGINGFTFRDPERLRAMHETTRHRGPDGESFFEDDNISLAHNRLAIIDLSSEANQPMHSSDGRFVIVYNGELYNYRELKKELAADGTVFRTSSDTEVLLEAFSRWGEGCLKKFNGIFAFAIWDRKEKRLTLARDHVGVKPLYYILDGSRLLFSSELKALSGSLEKHVVDPEALNAYFRLLYVPGEQTMLRGIKRLLPGHVASFYEGTFGVRPYWELHEGEAIRNYDEAVEGVRERLRAAVHRQLVSDRPLGVFLSGGFDSSAVLGLASEVASGPLKAFTVSYTSDFQQEKYNADAELAAKTAKHFGAEHHIIRLDAETAGNLLERVAYDMDEPVANHIQTSTFVLSEFAKPKITVALGGDGGDELFGGYPRYWYASKINALQRLPLPWKMFERASGGWRKLATTPGLDRHLSFIAQKEADVAEILKSEANDHSATTHLLAPYFEKAWRDQTNRLMAADVRTWLPDESLIRSDRLTMVHGLEQRVPILDPMLVEYAMRIPSRFKLGSRSQGKRVLIDAMRPWIAPHLFTEEKRAWNSPMAKWIRGPLESRVREILSPSFVAGTDAFLDFKRLNRMLDAHIERTHYALAPIWSAVTFQLWYRAFIHGRSH